MSGIRVGFQTHVHGHAPARELLPGLVDLFVAAEELGLDSGWIAQHHLGTEGRLASPLVLLGAVAARTERIRLGTTVVVLPLEDPVRLAEDAGVLDALAAGRLELGLGSGVPAAAEFAAFGVDAADRHAVYREKSARLRDLLGGGGLPAGLQVAPAAPDLLDRLWEATSTGERAAEVARAGHGLLLGVGPPAQQRQLAEAYLAARGPAAGPARIAAFRGLFPGADREERAAALWPDVRGVLAAPSVRDHLGADPTPHELLAVLGVHYGTTDDVVASVLADPALPLVGDYVFAVQAASTSIADAIRTVETLATQIAPELGRRPAGAPVSVGGTP